ncbi:MAG: pyridine nucleotide-disulfide oxidoreductase [Betaproteobacteria bacterium]|nr:pyridine nucleotide-disulfide oxidoreductase [Betaproteobacteria bacterium]
MKKSKLLVLVAVVAVIVLFFALDLGRFFSLDYLKSQQDSFAAYYHDHTVVTLAVYFLVYVAVTGLSLPGATVLTLAAGALFGLVTGTIVVSFASTVGATTAFLASRFLFRSAVQERFGDRLRTVNAGVEREGPFYLLTLRLVPVVPFFVINLVMGLTAMKARTFYWVSQVGMFAGTVAYVNAGTQLGRIETLRDVASPALIGSLVALGFLPLVLKKLVEFIKARKVYAGWNRPKRFDRNLVVIGAGSAGLVSAYIAAAVRAKVTLIEKHRMGGDCLNTGCVPSKALIRSAKFLSHVQRCREFGIRGASAEFDFGEVMARVQRVVSEVAPHDSVERYTGLGVECLQGEATITSPWTVDVRTSTGTRTLTTRSIVVAAGARPFVPPIPGIEETGYLTSDTLWDIRELPARLVVLGGGPIGCELAQAFARFGSKVTQVEMLPRIMMREDPEISDMVMARFRAEGVDVLVNHKAARFAFEGGEKVLYAETEGREVRIAFDQLICAVGRVANTTGYGLETLGIPTTKARTVEVNAFMATKFPNIFACGDVAGPYQFTHTAAHTAWYASVNALFGRFRKFRADFSVIPWATFTEPEVARVGLNETEAREKGVAYEVTTYGMDDLDRAIADGEAHGVVKVLTVPGKDRILGVTIVGEHAGDLIAEFVAAMRHRIGLNRILGTIHIYPTLAEANKYAAGNWKKAHAPEAALNWLARYHAWQRG